MQYGLQNTMMPQRTTDQYYGGRNPMQPQNMNTQGMMQPQMNPYQRPGMNAPVSTMRAPLGMQSSPTQSPFQYYDNPTGNLQPGMLGGAQGGGGMTAPRGGLGNMASDLYGIFSKDKWQNPYNAGMPYLQQIEGMGKQYFDPYINAGHTALDSLMGQYGHLINDPTFMMSQIGKNFQQSPGYQFQVDQALNAANRANAAGGTLGTPMEQQQIASTVNNLANQDYYNYLDRGLQQYGTGLSGLGGINQLGYGASSQLAQMLADMYGSQASNATEAQNAENMHNQGRQGQQGAFWGDLFGNLGSGIGDIASLASLFGL